MSRRSYSVLITNHLYDAAIAKYYSTDNVEIIKNFKDEISYVKRLVSAAGMVNQKLHIPTYKMLLLDQSNRIDEMYLDLLCEMPTPAIQLIIDEHESDIMKRAPKTIDRLTSVLTERGLLNPEIIKSTEKNTHENEVAEADKTPKEKED